MEERLTSGVGGRGQLRLPVAGRSTTGRSTTGRAVVGRPLAGGRYSAADFGCSPLLVFYEVTRACDMLCRHCRAKAQRRAAAGELTTVQSRRLISQLATFAKRPVLVLTGGDPFKREDLEELVGHAHEAGLRVAISPSATEMVTPERLAELARRGASAISLSMDGADAGTHDAFRGVAGSFQRTLELVELASAAGLAVQINTTLARHNLHQLEGMASRLRELPVTMWSVFFLVPMGRAKAHQRLSAGEIEMAFEGLYRHSQREPYRIKTTEAPHYRRFVLQQLHGRLAGQRASDAGLEELGLVGTNDGRGVMFVSHRGEYLPSGFMPTVAGQFPVDHPVRVYQDSAMFRALRDPTQLKGKCGMCEFSGVCGGSRARAMAISGDPLGAEPDCAYQPLAFRQQQEQLLCSV